MAINAVDEFANLDAALHEWSTGKIDTFDLIRAIRAVIDRLTVACFCSTDLCCNLHNLHERIHTDNCRMGEL